MFLSSGERSSFYIDARRLMLDSIASRLVSKLFYPYVLAWNVQAVGGMSLGGVPILSALVLTGPELTGFIVRGEKKDHGLQPPYEGSTLIPGSRVMIVDDVCTTGQSIQEVITVAELLTAW